MAKKNIALEWVKRCADSNGSMIMVPTKMIGDAEIFIKKSEEYLIKAKEFDKLSAEFDNFAKNFWYKTRQTLEKNGMEEIWNKNIGWNEEAKKDGIKIINIVAQNRPQPMQMR